MNRLRTWLMMTILLLVPSAVFAQASGGAKCVAGLEVASSNLLGLAGVFATKHPSVNPSIDCKDPSGFFVSAYGFFTVENSRVHEVDGFAGWRGNNGRWDYEARAGVYYISTGTDVINILSSRFSLGHTVPITDSLKVRFYSMVDNQYAWAGVGFDGKDTLGLGFGGTLSLAFAHNATARMTVESWAFPVKGFFATGSPNVKFRPGLDLSLPNDWTMTIEGIVMHGNQFNPLDDSWKSTLRLSFSRPL